MAEFQHITYTEYLPLILGPTAMAEILNTDRYNSSLDATVSNAFATAAFRFGHSMMMMMMTAAFRFGHSMVPEELVMADRSCPRQTFMSQPLETLFFNPSLLHKPLHLVMCLAGFCHATVNKPSRHFASSVSEKLFLHREDGEVGLDLVSINLQRGRDHGLPG